MADRRADPGHPAALAVLPIGDAAAGAASRPFRFRRHPAAGEAVTVDRPLIVEAPVAIEIDGIGYAVMMATPADLDDFAVGFCLAERLVDHGGQVRAVEPAPVRDGVVLRVALDPAVAGRTLDRVRHRTSDSSCGLCGIENLEQALRPLPRLAPGPQVETSAIFRALDRVRAHQPLGRETGAAHAAVCCAADGSVRLAREDAGRHNAFDKMVGAMARGGLSWDGGFALTTARLSFELVEKAALAGCTTVVAISAPTSLAVARAAAAGIRVVALARPDALLEAAGDGE